MGVYDYLDMGENELVYSVLQVIHIFFANILMLNFLIAILSATYENMKSSGTFKYKVNLYKYCERYMIAFENSTYGGLVLHPPPICYLSSLMIIFVFFKPAMKKISNWFSYMMFWLENMIFILFFALFEFLLVPVVYVKTFLNIMFCSYGLFTTIFKCIVWIFSGLFFDIFLALRDIYFLILILSMH